MTTEQPKTINVLAEPESYQAGYKDGFDAGQVKTQKVIDGYIKNARERTALSIFAELDKLLIDEDKIGHMIYRYIEDEKKYAALKKKWCKV